MKVNKKNRWTTWVLLAALSLMQLTVLPMALAQNQDAGQENNKVTGVVTDENGEGLPGASVIVKGTTNGVTTDINGTYALDVSENTVLTISYVGYQSQDVAVGSRSVIDFQMVPDYGQLDEVVVVGYGTQRKSDITGSVSSVKTQTLRQIPLARTDEALQGQVAGVRIQKNDASPNSKINIRIRGVSSVNGGNDPLIVIDGIQGTNLADIHPNDIASIEVLKDASATAIYGSRGASGVVLVTTKKGLSGTPTVTYNVYGSVATVRKELDLMNAAEYARVSNENRAARNLPLPFTDEEILNFEENGGTNWQDEIFRTGYSHNHHLTVSGGSGSVKYNVAGDYVYTEGIVIGSSYDKYSLRPNFSINLFKDKLELSLNSYFSRSMDHPTELNARDREGSPIYAASLFSPTTPVFNDDGTYTQPNHGGKGVGPNTEYNPVALALVPVRDNLQNQLIISPTLSYQIIEGLRISTNVSYQQTVNRDARYINEKIVNGGEVDRSASIDNSLWTSFQNTNILSYEKSFNDVHSIGVTGVFEQQRQDNSTDGSWNNNFLTNAVSYNNIGLGSNAGVYSYKDERSLRSFMGRINYSYDSRYLLTLTGRSDESSVFAKNNKRAFFPSVAVGWNVSNESFLEGSSVITNLKVRGSYGEVGNQAIGPYQSLAQLLTGSGANFSFDGSTVTTGVNLSTQAANPDLKWETTRQLNIGADVELFAGRISIVADYYKKNTEDLLLSRALPQASGYQTQLVNAGEVLNEGIELNLAGRPLTGAFEWNSQVTFSMNKNEVLALNSGETEFVVGDGAGLPGFNSAIWIEAGQSIGLIRGYEYAGVWKSDESLLAAGYGVTPGSPKYVDQNNDGLINNEDITNIGNTLPKYTFGWNNFFRYKDFDLGIIIQGVYGNDIYNIGRSVIVSNDGGTSRDLLDVWSEDNQDASIIGHNAMGGLRNDSRWIEDGSYIRVKNISLGYTLPASLSNSIGISSLRVYATGTNLFTFTDYSGYDPEGNNANSININGATVDPFLGVDHSSYPSQKVYTLGLDIKF